MFLIPGTVVIGTRLSRGFQGEAVADGECVGRCDCTRGGNGLPEQRRCVGVVFETGALMQGLILLYLGGRMAMSPSEFRAFCHRSFGRYLNGILT